MDANGLLALIGVYSRLGLVLGESLIPRDHSLIPIPFRIAGSSNIAADKAHIADQEETDQEEEKYQKIELG